MSSAADSMSMDFSLVEESARFIRSRIGEFQPQFGIICGSGLAQLGLLVENCVEIGYEEIPHFPKSTAPGHKSRLMFGLIHGRSIVLMQGRFHLYEGYSIHKMAMPVRVLHLLGVKGLIVTNAAGGLNTDFNVGDIMILRDHLSFMSFVGISPLAGINDDRFGPRFFQLNDAYNKKWRKIAVEVAEALKIEKSVKEGVYTMLGGPNFETPTELKMLKMCGVDAVGMSTVHEVVTARHCGMKVLAFSLITNPCVLETAEEDNVTDLAEEVFDVAKKSELLLKDFVGNLIQKLGEDLEKP